MSAVVLIFSASVAAAAVTGIPPEAYADPVDQQIAKTGKGIPGRPIPCGYERDDGKVIESRPTSSCYKMTSQRRWRGLWMSGHESSLFCPEPARSCDIKTPGVAALERGPGLEAAGYGSIYRVDFIGRSTKYRADYSGLNFFDRIVVMDRAISIELIKAAPITGIRRCVGSKGGGRPRQKWCFKGQSQK